MKERGEKNLFARAKRTHWRELLAAGRQVLGGRSTASGAIDGPPSTISGRAVVECARVGINGHPLVQ